MSEIDDILVRCANPESGCFAGQPKALNGMVYMDDALLRANWNQVAIAADKAGAEGVPLEDTTYTTVILKGSGVCRLVEGEERRIGDLEPPEDDTLQSTQGFDYVVAQRAYQCGKNAETCPLKQELSGHSDETQDNDARWEDSEEYQGSHLS